MSEMACLVINSKTFYALCDAIDAVHAGLERENVELRQRVTELDKRDDSMHDADGEPIHIGDVMEWCDSGETLAVEGIGIDVLFYIDGENAEWTAVRNKRHHHADSWERIIADAAATRCDFDALVARCKALAGDAE